MMRLPEFGARWARSSWASEISLSFGFVLCLFLGGSGSAQSLEAAQAREFDCLIAARREIAVSSPIEGAIDEVLVDRGDLIKKGQVLARLETSVERAALAEARERARMGDRVKSAEVALAFARRNLDRQTALHLGSVASKQLLDDADTSLQLAELEVESAKREERIARLVLARSKAELERRTIRSPVDGVVVERILSKGEYADPPQIVRVAEVDPLVVKVIVPVRYLVGIVSEARASVTPEAPFSEVLVAQVSAIDRVVDAASGTFGVRLELPNPDMKIPAGLKCRVRFDPPPSNVPLSALTDDPSPVSTPPK